jgi:nicotinamidase-related amidase
MTGRGGAWSTDAYTRPNLRSAALITIDTQRDVLNGGALEVAGTSQALAAISDVVLAFRETDRAIIHAVRLYAEDASNVDLCRRSAAERGQSAFVAGSRGAQLAEALLPGREVRLDCAGLLRGELQPLGGDEAVMYKPRWGAFYETSLDEHLRARGIDTLVFCGCNFPNCPRTSIYEASERDFRIVLVRDAISGLYERGEQELAGVGVSIVAAGELVEALRSPVERSVSAP